MAPEHAVRASSIDTDGGEDWFKVLKAREAPVIPDPIITIDDVDGRRGVVRWFAREAGGSCQYDTVGLGNGRLGGIEARDSIKSSLTPVEINVMYCGHLCPPTNKKE